jgi:hypothetical protein
VSKERKKQAAYDERIRNAIEGKFGQGKRRFSLARTMAKLENTSRTAIAITFLVINLSTWWRRFFCVFLCRSGKTMSVFGFNIICGYIWLKLRQSKVIFRLVWLVSSAVIIMKAIAPRLYAMLARSLHTFFFHKAVIPTN